jgi:hypothetical protein
MNDARYIGLDVHRATISVAVLDSDGRSAMEAILETKAETILPFVSGLRGSLHLTFEEGTCAAWLHADRLDARNWRISCAGDCFPGSIAGKRAFAH